jgi:hypothetical protein
VSFSGLRVVSDAETLGRGGASAAAAQPWTIRPCQADPDDRTADERELSKCSTCISPDLLELSLGDVLVGKVPVLDRLLGGNPVTHLVGLHGLNAAAVACADDLLQGCGSTWATVRADELDRPRDPLVLADLPIDRGVLEVGANPDRHAAIVPRRISALMPPRVLTLVPMVTGSRRSRLTRGRADVRMPVSPNLNSSSIRVGSVSTPATDRYRSMSTDPSTMNSISQRQPGTAASTMTESGRVWSSL